MNTTRHTARDAPSPSQPPLRQGRESCMVIDMSNRIKNTVGFLPDGIIPWHKCHFYSIRNSRFFSNASRPVNTPTKRTLIHNSAISTSHYHLAGLSHVVSSLRQRQTSSCHIITLSSRQLGAVRRHTAWCEQRRGCFPSHSSQLSPTRRLGPPKQPPRHADILHI